MLPLIDSLLEQSGLKAKLRPVMRALYVTVDSTDLAPVANPGAQRLAQMTGLSSRTVQRHLGELVELSVIERLRRRGRNAPTWYQLNLTKLGQVPAANLPPDDVPSVESRPDNMTPHPKSRADNLTGQNTSIQEDARVGADIYKSLDLDLKEDKNIYNAPAKKPPRRCRNFSGKHPCDHVIEARTKLAKLLKVDFVILNPNLHRFVHEHGVETVLRYARELHQQSHKASYIVNGGMNQAAVTAWLEQDQVAAVSPPVAAPASVPEPSPCEVHPPDEIGWRDDGTGLCYVCDTLIPAVATVDEWARYKTLTERQREIVQRLALAALGQQDPELSETVMKLQRGGHPVEMHLRPTIIEVMSQIDLSPPSLSESA